MAGLGGKRPGAGRPKGAKTKKRTVEAKAQKAMTAIAQVAALAVPDTGLTMPSEPPSVAPAGISAKDLLLTTMRMAWASAHRKAAEAANLDALALAATDSETMESFKKTANELRLEVGRHVAIAQQAAKDVAPYEHARLQAVDATVSGGIVVEIKQYNLPAPADKRPTKGGK